LSISLGTIGDFVFCISIYFFLSPISHIFLSMKDTGGLVLLLSLLLGSERIREISSRDRDWSHESSPRKRRLMALLDATARMRVDICRLPIERNGVASIMTQK